MFKKSEKGLKIAAYCITALFLFLIVIPLIYIASLSLESENAMYSYPPRFFPEPGRSISIVLDYSKYKDRTEDDLKDMILKDSTLAMYSTSYEFNKVTIGEVKVYGTIDDRIIYYSRAHGLFLKLHQLVGVYNGCLISSRILLDQGRYKASADDIGYTFALGGVGKPIDRSKLGQNDMDGAIGDYLSTDFKTSGEFKGTTVSSSYLLLLENYKYYFKMPQYVYAKYPNVKSFSFFAFMFNTTLTFVWTMLCQVSLCALTAYPLSKLLSKKVADRILLFFLATMMIPWITIMVPQLILVQDLNMYNNYGGMLFVWLLPSPFYIFLYKGFFDRIPSSFFDAARIDGSNEFNTFTRICLPMSKPIVALIALNSFISGWTDFFWYFLVANKPNLWTLNVAIYIMSGISQIKMNFVMGLAVVTILPVLVVTAVFSKQIKSSIMGAGLKG